MVVQRGTQTSPLTGWDRPRWAALADRMLGAVRPYASPRNSRITLPGVEGGYGQAVDGLEGFARTFLLAGFRLAGERGADPHGYAQWYADGIRVGVDPDSDDRWVRLTEHAQAKVEAASIALVLDLTRPWIWDALSARTQEQVVDYLAECIGDTTYPRNNWCWFRLVVQTFLKSVGGPYSLEDMESDLALHDSFRRSGGWYSDGDERSFDHYAGWALHLYPTLWARMAGAEDLAADRRERDRALLDEFLADAIHLVGADGGPLVQGRSLLYRFAAAAPFWVGALAEVPSVAPGLLRRAASGIVGYFADHGVPDQRGLLTQGWHHEWLPMLQSYSGPSSPYWASKGMLGLALPADHPAWTAVEEPLPVERADTLRVIDAPGWVVAGTRADGIVRVINHGTDHARQGDRTGDSPLYARYGYSTATCPWLDEGSWRHPADQSVALVDAAERVSHRAGWVPIAPRIEDGVAVAGSVVDAHWIDMPVRQTLYGSGWTGQEHPAGRLTVVSLVRRQWEVRLVRVDHLADAVDPAGLTLRITGWPTVGGDGLTSGLEPVRGEAQAGVLTRAEASPLGPGAVAPALTFPAHPGRWVAAFATLTGDDVGSGKATLIVEGAQATVLWPDGVTTTTDLPPEDPTSPRTDRRDLMDQRYATNPEQIRLMDTAELRRRYLVDDVFIPGTVTLTYTHQDRIVIGGAAPDGSPLSLTAPDELRAEYFLQFREIGIVNVGGTGTVTVDGERYELPKGACLYVGRGSKDVVFDGTGAQFYLFSAPAHTAYPTVLTLPGQGNRIELGDQLTSNSRTINQYIHLNGVQSCQVVMGVTELNPGSLWNTMPAHTHDRRTECYLYFDVPEDARIIHLLGEPAETRHLVVADRQAVISPSWSIHAGVGTASYAFVWAMAGENQEFTDMDPVPPTALG